MSTVGSTSHHTGAVARGEGGGAVTLPTEDRALGCWLWWWWDSEVNFFGEVMHSLWITGGG